MRKRYGFVYVNRGFEDLLDLARYKKKSFYWYKKSLLQMVRIFKMILNTKSLRILLGVGTDTISM
ncbi:MAG: family 1 glycosylhydrolase [Coprobacillus cateniformis]